MMEEKLEEKRSEDDKLVALKMEEEATSHGLQTASRSRKKTRKQIPPLEPPKNSSPIDPFWISDLQNYKVINLHCFKTLSVWQFVTEAIGNRYTWFSRGQDGGLNDRYVFQPTQLQIHLALGPKHQSISKSSPTALGHKE